MKVRIGISLGPAGTPGQFAETVDLLEQAGVDSLWLSEITYSPLVEPFTGMAFALARTRRLKAGTGVSVLPGRNPVLVAKQLASLAGLAPGRVLPVFGVLPAQPAERALFDVPDGRRAAVFDESLRLIRLLLTAERVSFDGEFFTVSDATVGALPAKPLDIWLGGSAPAGLRRVGRLADGGRGSFRPQPAGHAGRKWRRHPGPAPRLHQPPPARRRSGDAGRPGLGRRPPDDRALRRGRAEQVRGAAGEPRTVRPLP